MESDNSSRNVKGFLIMLGFFKKASRKVGLPPGTLLHVGEKRAEEVKISIIDYDEQTISEKELDGIEEALPLKDTPTVSWINIDGLHEVDIIEKIGKHFGLHPLVLEDIVHAGQRPKMDDFGDYLLIISQMLSYDDQEDKLIIEQFSLVISPHCILSFQEMEGNVFEPVRERIRNAKGRIRKMGSDYLAYALIDAIVDQYFVALEKIGEQLTLRPHLKKKPWVLS